MKSIWATALSLALIGEGRGAHAAPPVEQAPSQYRVSGIRSRFFLHESGVLEAEEASQEGGWNMMLKAEAMLVLVDLAGPQFPAGKRGALDFTATSGKTRLFHRWQSLEHNYVSDSGHVTLPFLVYGVGCEPIKISVALVVAGKRSTQTAVIPLACGE